MGPEAPGAQGGQVFTGYLWTRAAVPAGRTPFQQFFFPTSSITEKQFISLFD